MELNDRSSIFPRRRGSCDPPNIVQLLNARQTGARPKCRRQLGQFAEIKNTVSQLKETQCVVPPYARSTFLMAFSPDCTKVASTHGDHNIYVSDVATGKHLSTLVGHPRTPWCIAFHPVSNDLLASGCLAGEVRVWDFHGGSVMWRVYSDAVIASLTFHPFNQILVIATGSCLYFWDWSQPQPYAQCSTNNALERLRYVKFDRYGHNLITGISNARILSFGKSLTRTVYSVDNVSVDSYRSQRGIIREDLISMPNFSIPGMSSAEDRMETSTLNRPDQLPSTSRAAESSSSNTSVTPYRGPGSNNLFGFPESIDTGTPLFPRHIELLRTIFDDSFSEQVRDIVHSWATEGLAGIIVPNDSESDSPSETPPRHNSPSINIDVVQPLDSDDFVYGAVTEANENAVNDHSYNSYDTSDLDYDDILYYTGVFWVAFSRVRSVCIDLERRLINYVDLQTSTSFPRPATFPVYNETLGTMTYIGSRNPEILPSPNPYVPVIEMLARMRLDLHFTRFSLTTVRCKVAQVYRILNNIMLSLRELAARTNIDDGRRAMFSEMGEQLLEQVDRLEQAEVLFSSAINHAAVRAAQNSALSSVPSQFLQERAAASEHSMSIDSSDVASEMSSVNNAQITGDSPGPQSYDSTPQYPFVPSAVSSSARRNSTSQFLQSIDHVNISSHTEHSLHDNAATSATENDNRSSTSSNNGTNPTLLTEYPQRTAVFQERNVVVHPEGPSTSEGSEYSNNSNASALPSESLPSVSEPTSESSSNGSRNTDTHPNQIYLPALTPLMFTGSSRTDYNELILHHRIQSWDFTSFRPPLISDATANVVVRRSMIHNDASVDISQDGQKLVALVPSGDKEANYLVFGVFSLNRNDLGRPLCMWGYISNAISVSFSPYAEYVLVGSAYHRPMYTNPERTVVAQIIKLSRKNQPGENRERYIAEYVRSFTQEVTDENRYQQINLNCVKWLPESGLGFAYATNKGDLRLCKPLAGEILSEQERIRDGSDGPLNPQDFEAVMRQ